MMLAVLFLAAVTFEPAQPTVGDPVTITFAAAPVTLEPSPAYEVVSQEANRVVVRTFAPEPFEVRGTAAGEAVSVRIPVRSVLQPNDAMTPAPLAEPRRVPYARDPFVAIGIAALAAVAVWILVFVRARRRREKPAAPELPPGERFRAAILALQRAPSWGRLADETRLYLAATRPHLRLELTTSELVPRLAERERFVAHILWQGDLEKFSVRGAQAGDFEESVRRALELAAPRARIAEEAVAS